MTDLQRALYQFAQETRIPSLVHGEEKELRDNQKMVRAAREELCALGGQAADLAGRLEQGLLVCAANDREAGFLADLSIGLGLGRG